jgi:hypothetical protein
LFTPFTSATDIWNAPRMQRKRCTMATKKGDYLFPNRIDS